MQPVITIFCPFTRRWAVDDWLKNLSHVSHDPAQTNICIIVDCDEQYIVNMVKKFVEERQYRSFNFKINSDHHPNEVRLSLRRQRVAEVHNQSKDLIAKTDGDIIIGLEDDTVFDRMKSFKPLYEPILTTDQVGFVEGVQMGRWGANIIGAWQANDNTDPTEVKTILDTRSMPYKDNYQRITAGGFYGYATRRHLYLNHEYYSASSQPWGPDVNYGFYVNQQGFTCHIDWNTVFGHNDFGKVIYPDDPKIRLAQVVYNKDVNTGKWNRTDHEKTRY